MTPQLRVCGERAVGSSSAGWWVDGTYSAAWQQVLRHTPRTLLGRLLILHEL